MKTNYSTFRSLPLLSISALMLLILASCGSYQKTSDQHPDDSQNDQTTAQSIYYKNYFSSLNEQNEEIITDVDNYSSTAQDSTTYVEKSYGGWGSSYENVTVNIYDNSWGYNPWYGVGWGWGGYYYGGWGLSLGWGGWGPGYGYGWGGYYGGYYPYYGVGYYPYYGGYYNNNFYGRTSPNRYYASNNMRDGRRFTTPTADRGGRRYSDNAAIGRNSQSVRSGTQGNRPTTYRTTTTRNSSTRNATTSPGTRNSSPQVRTNSGTRNNNYTPSRNSGVRSQPSSAPSRTYSPGNSGGSRPSGGGGGGVRSGGGGGRRG